MITAFKIRCIYLFMYMAFAVWRVFYNIYLEDEGLTGAQIGTLNAIMQATIFIVVAAWGVVADRRGIRPTLRLLVVATSAVIFLLGYMSDFWMLVFYIPLVTLFYHPLGPLADAMAVQYSETEKKHSFGGFRMWGSLGWAIASILGGVLIYKTSIKYIFPVSAGMFLILIPLLSTRKKVRVFRPNFERLRLRELTGNTPLLFFIVVITLYGVTCSPVNSYLNLYFTELGAGKDIVGYAYAIMAFSELPFFIVGNRLLKRIGAKQLILLAMFTMFIRFIIYGIFSEINIALLVGLLQGVSLAFFLVGAVDYIKNLVPSGRHAIAQSILWGGYVGVGHTVGNFINGFIIDKSGMVSVMQIFSGVSVACCVLAIVYFRGTSEVFTRK